MSFERLALQIPQLHQPPQHPLELRLFFLARPPLPPANYSTLSSPQPLQLFQPNLSPCISPIPINPLQSKSALFLFFDFGVGSNQQKTTDPFPQTYPKSPVFEPTLFLLFTILAQRLLTASTQSSPNVPLQNLKPSPFTPSRILMPPAYQPHPMSLVASFQPIQFFC